MNKKIKIGYLFPYSSIHPNMSQDVMDGFFAAIPEIFRNYFQFCPEFVNLGGINDVKAAINKLTMFENVDVLSGFLSYNLLPEILPLITKKKLCFFFDMGEYLPQMTPLPETIFYNSFQLWQLQYALGKWGQSKFKGKGAMLMSVYDAGYHIHSSFWQGAQDSGAEEIDMHTIPYNRDTNDIKTVLPHFFDKIEKSGVDYIHALFCGNEALDFFQMYKQSGLYNKIPLIVTPHMASDEVISKVGSLGIDFYSASGWNYLTKSDSNNIFKKQFEGFCGRKATLFSVMGYEMGLSFQQIIPQLQKNDIDGAIDFLKTNYVEGPRGKRNFWIDNKDQKPAIAIEKISLQTMNYTQFVVDQGKTMEYNSGVFNDIHTNCKSGWKNPYLCI